MRPSREMCRQAGQTYFATFQTARRQCFFRNEWSTLLLTTLERYNKQLQLHDFAIMPYHVHLLLNPEVPLEKAIQLIKGGFSFSARREFSWKGDIWQAGFTDHRIREDEDFARHVTYLEKNVQSPSAEGVSLRGLNSAVALAEFPQWLKPPAFRHLYGGAKAPPLQSEQHLDGGAKAPPLQSEQHLDGGAEAPPLQSATSPLKERTDIHYAKDAEDLFRKLGI